MKKTLLVVIIALLSFTAGAQVKELYELRVYEMRMGMQAALENYLSSALIPALNKHGVASVGVFRELSKNEPTKIYVLIPYSSWDSYLSVKNALDKDDAYQKNSATYNQIPVDKPVYDRMTTSFMIAFDGLPKMIKPADGPRIFELRTYEGYSEDATKRKIKMFNEDELSIFYETKLNPVFFGEVIAGDRTPCLTYMLVFKDMEERDKNWQAFGSSPKWQKISKDEKYANTVSRITRVFLEPLSISEL